MVNIISTAVYIFIQNINIDSASPRARLYIYTSNLFSFENIGKEWIYFM